MSGQQNALGGGDPLASTTSPRPAASSHGAAGGGGGSSPVRNMCYARLVRVSAEPVTPTLPDVIPLQGPGDDDKVITLGRHRENNHQLDCPRVPSLLSRYHAKIIVLDNAHYVVDENTLNGTYVSGQPNNIRVQISAPVGAVQA